MIKLLIAIILCLPMLSKAEEPPYSQGEFLSMLQNDKATMTASPSMNNPSYLDKRAKIEKMVFPKFDRSMFSYYYYTQGKYTYTIMWDWNGERCVFGIDKIKTLAKEGPIWDRDDFKQRHPNDTPETVGETIKKSFCEKLYGLKL